MMLASVTAKGFGATDLLLEQVVAQLGCDGFSVLGALRVLGQTGENPHCNSDLLLLPKGPVVRITQDLGAGSEACRMDAGALEEAVGLATARLKSEGADLVVLNKFGLRESEGHGFRTLIAAAVERRIPVLVGLSETHRPAFESFAGEMATALPPNVEAILAWCRTVSRPSKDPSSPSARALS